MRESKLRAVLKLSSAAKNVKGNTLTFLLPAGLSTGAELTFQSGGVSP
jgi:hypothetical protein